DRVRALGAAGAGRDGLDATPLGRGEREAEPVDLHDGRRARPRRALRRPLRGRPDDEAVAGAGAPLGAVKLDAPVGEPDAYFRVRDVRGDFFFVEATYPPRPGARSPGPEGPGGGALVAVAFLRDARERGCQTSVTGNATTLQARLRPGGLARVP